MRICLVNTYHYRRGGDSTYTFDLADLLKANGHEVVHFGMDHPSNVETPYRDFFVSHVDYREASHSSSPFTRLRTFMRCLYSFEARSKFDAFLEETRPDIVHLQNFRRHLTFSILAPPRKRRIPVVFTAHDYDPICPNSLLFAGTGICEICRGKHYYRAPFRRCKEDSFLGTAAIALEGYFVKLGGYFKQIDTIITPSSFMRSKLVEYGFDEERVRVINNFIDTSAFEPCFEPGGYALFFGRLSREKGIDTLIGAARELKERRILIAGDGPIRADLEAISLRLECDNVKFLGYVEKERLFDIVRGAAFVVTPSVWYENFPYNILESFAAGKPVIGSNIGGIPELIVDGKTGLLVPPNDAGALAQAMNRLLSDQSLTEELGRNARRKVEDEFNAEVHYDRLVNVYTGLAG